MASFLASLASALGALTVGVMTCSDAPHHRHTITHAPPADTGLVPSRVSWEPDIQQGGAVAFLAEIAALTALDDAAFADVVPSARAPVVAPVVARGRLGR